MKNTIRATVEVFQMTRNVTEIAFLATILMLKPKRKIQNHRVEQDESRANNR